MVNMSGKERRSSAPIACDPYVLTIHPMPIFVRTTTPVATSERWIVLEDGNHHVLIVILLVAIDVNKSR